VVAAAREGDASAHEVLDRFAGWLALGIANLINVLDCEIVVVGGGVSEEADLFLDRTRDEVARRVVGHDRRPMVPIVRARLGERAGAVGAALLAMART
jgi:glucokinase